MLIKVSSIAGQEVKQMLNHEPKLRRNHKDWVTTSGKFLCQRCGYLNPSTDALDHHENKVAKALARRLTPDKVDV